MDEFFPVLAGVVLGLIIARMRKGALRNVTTMVVSLALGVCASWVGGELAKSAWYALIDTAQVFAASVMIALLVKLCSRRAKGLA